MPDGVWIRILVVGLAADVVWAAAVNLAELRGLLIGNASPAGFQAVVGVLLSALVVLAGVATVRQMGVLRRALHRGRQSLDADAALTADWVWESDVHHRFTYSSPGVERLLGYRPEELLGRSGLTLLAEDDVGEATAILHDAIEYGHGWDTTGLTWVHADGSRVVLHGQAAPIKDEHGRVIGLRGRRRALTAAELRERVTVQAQQRVSAVLSASAVDVALQPIVDLSTGCLAGAEALARFRDGRPPDVWFEDAAAADRAVELDRLTFGTALPLLDRLPPYAYLSVNATPDLVLSGHLADELAARGVPWDRIVVELTEHARIADYEAVQAVLSPLRERGIRLAIDDTGAGFASLSHVLKLRPDIIKVDRSLIVGIETDPARRALVTSLVQLGRETGARITAEGVETSRELQTLASLGADCGQGYLLGRPTTDPSCWQAWADTRWHRAQATQPAA